MVVFSQLLLSLAIYSFLGWVAEVLFVFVGQQKLENRGFLTGPFVPIYGFGAAAMILLVQPYVENPFLVFLASVVIASVLEYVTSFLLDKLFHVRLWDYSGKRFNLHGRICLENSMLFGALGLLLLYVIHPVVTDLLRPLPGAAVIAVAWSLLGIVLVDAANSIRSMAKVRPVLDDLHGTLEQAHDRIEQVARDAHAAEEQRRAGDATHRSTVKRLARVFPGARSTRPAPAPTT